MGVRADGTVECPAGLNERHEVGSASHERCLRRAQGGGRSAMFGISPGTGVGVPGVSGAPPSAASATGDSITYFVEAQEVEVGLHMLCADDGQFRPVVKAEIARGEFGGPPQKVFTLADGSRVMADFDDRLDVQEMDEESALVMAETEEAPPAPVVSPRVTEVSSVLEKAKLSVLDHTLVTGLTPNDFPAASVQQVDGKVRLSLRGGKPAKAEAFEAKALMALEAKGWRVVGGRREKVSAEFFLEKR